MAACGSDFPITTGSENPRKSWQVECSEIFDESDATPTENIYEYSSNCKVPGIFEMRVVKLVISESDKSRPDWVVGMKTGPIGCLATWANIMEMLFYIVIIGVVKTFLLIIFFKKGTDDKYAIVCQMPINIDGSVGDRPDKLGFTSIQLK